MVARDARMVARRHLPGQPGEQKWRYLYPQPASRPARGTKMAFFVSPAGQEALQSYLTILYGALQERSGDYFADGFHHGVHLGLMDVVPVDHK